mgnify:CR=1 FL=1
MSHIKNISRRSFVRSIGLASGGLILACNTSVFSDKDKKPEVAFEQKTQKPLLKEEGGFYFSSHITIKDPNTDEVLVKMRAD